MTNIIQITKDNAVDIYDSTGAVAEAVHQMDAEKVHLFTRDMNDIGEGVTVSEFLTASAACMSTADVCMLDGRALKVLAVKYPSDARYVLARVAFRSGWVVGLPGLLRRVFLGRVRLGGIRVLVDSRNRKSYWLVINKTNKTVKKERLFLPTHVGVTTFLSWMRKEGVSYVVPRFYEQLPDLHREGGDLDLLVADSDASRVKSYLQGHMEGYSGSNADTVPIGLHTVSRADGVPYYPPPLARQILDGAIDGPAGSRIPAPKDVLLSFIYHCLYHHKGYSTGIPTNLDGRPEQPPENDYAYEVQRMADAQGVVVGETMEDMDDYLAKEGWRPKRDTLAKIAERNAWVRDRFFGEHGSGVTGLSVYLLKERVLERDLVGDIVEYLKGNGLTIIRVETLDEEQKQRALDHVRGGNWVDASGVIEGQRPAVIVIAVDPQCANLPAAHAGEYERVCAKRQKNQLREVIDEAGEASLVHAADNTQEAWEYVETCLPNNVEDIRLEVEHFAQASHLARWRRFLSPTYITLALKFAIRNFVVRRLL